MMRTVTSEDQHPPSALHVNDCAFTTRRLLHRAHELGLPWSYQPVAAKGRTWDGISGKATKAVLGARWLAVLAARAYRNDILHIHSGSVLRHSRYVPKSYVLQLHGSDVRTLQYDPAWTSIIRRGLREAQYVYYPTPELAEHTLPHRPDAEYMAIPIDLRELPPWSPPEGQRPVVLFASRWDPVKGLDTQLQLARDVVRAVGDRADVIGLEWGAATDEARRAGLTLRPRVDLPTYLGWLASADVVVGQASGILATSELETLGMGAPLVLPVPVPLYKPVPPPVLGGDVASAVDAIQTLLTSDHAGHDTTVGPAWIEEYHGISQAVDRIAALYQRLMSR
jgi:glycosyltransferase involved in cell wall biosynthesis